LIASSAYFLRNIGNNNRILEEIFSILIRMIIHGEFEFASTKVRNIGIQNSIKELD